MAILIKIFPFLLLAIICQADIIGEEANDDPAQGLDLS